MLDMLYFTFFPLCFFCPLSAPINSPVERNKRKWELCDSSDNMCDDCGQFFTVKEGLRWYVGKCQKRRKQFHDSRTLTPTNKTEMRKTDIRKNPIGSPDLISLKTLLVSDNHVTEKVTKKIPHTGDTNSLDRCG